MEEKIIIKGEKQRFTLFYYVIGLVGMVCVLIPFIDQMIDPGYHNKSLMYNVIHCSDLHTFLWPIGIAFIAVAVIFPMVYSRVELTITNKRVFGTAAFGKRVDLPLDSVSAVGSGVFHSITITSASGAIKFGMLSNRDELYKAISKLLIDRQDSKQPIAQTPIKPEIPQSNADELKKYKDLLDSGVISQEEFDAKKKQLLGL